MEGRVDGLRIVLLGIVLDGEGRREDLPRELGVVAFATAPQTSGTSRNRGEGQQPALRGVGGA